MSKGRRVQIHQPRTRYPHAWRCVRAFPLHHRTGRLRIRRPASGPRDWKDIR